MRPVYDGLLRYSGAARRGAAAATTSPVHTVSRTTAAVFLPSLRRHDQYDALASVVANTVVISGGSGHHHPGRTRLAAAIAGATQLHRPAAGHMLLDERPECVSDAIDRATGMREITAHGATG